MKVAIYSRGTDEEMALQLPGLVEALNKHKIEIVLLQNLPVNSHLIAQNIPYLENTKELDATVDFLISLGGDGTMLDAVTLVKDKNIPILGINFGRLGFLAGIGKNDLASAVDALVNGTYLIDKRSLIHVEADSPLFNGMPFALNEFALHKRDLSPMIKIHTYLNGEFLNTYWSDGVIVSTPTGSTGYNMSCNGPIIFPDSGSFVITPIAPHNLNIRPIVVPDNHIISFEIEGRIDQFICSLDARREIVDKNIQIAVKKEAFTISLVRLSENSFLGTLRTKLSWGLDKRN